MNRYKLALLASLVLLGGGCSQRTPVPSVNPDPKGPPPAPPEGQKPEDKTHGARVAPSPIADRATA